MKSRFETDNAIDFATLKQDDMLAQLRILANLAPLLLDATVRLGADQTANAAALRADLARAGDPFQVSDICTAYADSMIELTDAYRDLITHTASLLGYGQDGASNTTRN